MLEQKNLFHSDDIDAACEELFLRRNYKKSSELITIEGFVLPKSEKERKMVHRALNPANATPYSYMNRWMSFAHIALIFGIDRLELIRTFRSKYYDRDRKFKKEKDYTNERHI